ncbi:MAG: hypothetical protein ACOCY6_00045 [Halodesulfurarchaeum sp.]
MKRTLTIILIIGAMAFLLGAVTVGAAAVDDRGTDDIGQSPLAQENETTENETIENETTENETQTVDENGTAENTAVQPGARLAGIAGVHQAELEGTIAERAFDRSMNTSSNETRASVLVNHTDQLEQRLENLENRSERLEADYENDTISKSAYQAQLAHLEARINSIERLLERTGNETAMLPMEARMATGLNETNLYELRTRASNLSGPEVSSIAREIAGPGVGHHAMRAAAPGWAGPPTKAWSSNDTWRGPPTDDTVGPPDGMGPSENTTVDPSTNRTGPPTNESSPKDSSTREPNTGGDNRQGGPPSETREGNSPNSG